MGYLPCTLVGIAKRLDIRTDRQPTYMSCLPCLAYPLVRFGDFTRSEALPFYSRNVCPRKDFAKIRKLSESCYKSGGFCIYGNITETFLGILKDHCVLICLPHLTFSKICKLTFWHIYTMVRYLQKDIVVPLAFVVLKSSYRTQRQFSTNLPDD